MRTYTYSEARQRLATLLDQARREGRVQIRRQDGSTFVLQPVVADRSPLDVPGVRSRLRRGELVALVREERERSGERILEALSNKRLQLSRARPAVKKPRRRHTRPRS
ncbi:MAG: type II toxin-antitoxin system Phd/YefM family antitoxin [Candidatus Binatota bacterium]